MKPTQIILHHSLTKDSETVSWGAIRRYHTQTMGWSNIGYHYGVELVGDYYEILVGRYALAQGAHTLGQNQDSIGVCLVGNFDIATPPKYQWDRAVGLVRSLMDTHGITWHRVFGHNQYASYKTCPGKMFDMEAFKRALK